MQNLKIMDAEGSKLQLIRQENKWQIVSPFKNPISFEYEVVLGHREFECDLDTSPYLKPDCILWTGRALFFENRAKNIEVLFHIPQNWKISTPWISNSSPKKIFFVKNNSELNQSLIVIGLHLEKQLKIKNTEILIAIGGKYKQLQEQIVNIIHKGFVEFSNIFGGIPLGKKLIVINPYELGKYGFQGGVLNNSASVLTSYYPDGINSFWFTRVVLHEICHLWNGSVIRAKYHRRCTWFLEGFTDYYTLVVAKRLNFINKQQFLTFLEYAFNHYHLKIQKHSLVDNFQRRNRRFVYHGGFLVALFLDIRIRLESKKNLDNLMKIMFHTYRRKGYRYRIRDIMEIAEHLSSKKFNVFFKKYIYGKHALPLQTYAPQLGVKIYKEEITLPYFSLKSIVNIPEGIAFKEDIKSLIIKINSTVVTSKKDIVKELSKNSLEDKELLFFLKEGKQITQYATFSNSNTKVIYYSLKPIITKKITILDKILREKR
ncbi:hypothetical protein [Candidatus Uabimicrobium sp. HlEnr_7]|uniref:M61 family metallopeptidase n=1 Tax=Candidatus Uabimicrobium helgolandensis TaxID=3095367 RepID=UPI00355852B7